MLIAYIQKQLAKPDVDDSREFSLLEKSRHYPFWGYIYTILSRMIYALLLLGFLSPLQADSFKPLNINVIGYKNGVGLEQDVSIMMEELANLGHQVRYILYCDPPDPVPRADINVFLDLVNESIMSAAPLNFWVPNPEWCFLNRSLIANMSLILCKTKESERIFKMLNSHTVFLGFTCHDQREMVTQKNYRSLFHLGASNPRKGTTALIQAWSKNPLLPLLRIVKHKGAELSPAFKNVELITNYVSKTELMEMQNKCGMHVCPSETEGFGYSIIEALSCGNVVVTTNAPPMNEFVQDPRCLIPYAKTQSAQLATTYIVNPEDVEVVVKRLLELPDAELRAIGEKNRSWYIENHRQFKERLRQIFNHEAVNALLR